MSTNKTFKNKLELLKNLKKELEELQNKITNLTSSINRNYNINNSDYDFTDSNIIKHCSLKTLSEKDFNDQNKKLIEKKEQYAHNQEMIKSILNSKTKKNITLNNLNEAQDFIKKNIKSININLNDSDSEESDDEEIDEETIKLLNDKIDIEYEFNLKILKSYCIFCHHRDILLPSKTELNDIKDKLEGYLFIDKKSFQLIPKKTILYYLYIADNGKIAIQSGKFISIANNGILVKLSNKTTKYLNYLNPIFRKINLNDI